MNVNRVLTIKDGDALSTLRLFLSKLWLEAGINAMLLPMELPNDLGLAPQIVTRPEGVTSVNPFAPIMTDNAAAVISNFVEEYRGRLAVMLRPCELRALWELRKRRRVAWHSPADGQTEDWLLVIGVDCPGTLTAAEYTHRVFNQGVDELTHQALAFGQKDGLKTSQLRTACQICRSNQPRGADITIGAIGTDMPAHFLTIAWDEAIDHVCHLDHLTDRIATEEEVVQREEEVGKIADEHEKHRASLCADGGGRFDELCSLLACFSRCTLCADCLDACPLYDGELAGMLGVKAAQTYEGPLLSELVGLGRWLVSCSGCGMCQESCENNVPLTKLISTLSYRIQQELHYTPGEPNQSLPWRTANHPTPRRIHKEGANVVPG